jgi:hypothetical protein
MWMSSASLCETLYLESLKALTLQMSLIWILLVYSKNSAISGWSEQHQEVCSSQALTSSVESFLSLGDSLQEEGPLTKFVCLPQAKGPARCWQKPNHRWTDLLEGI